MCLRASDKRVNVGTEGRGLSAADALLVEHVAKESS